MNASKKVQAWEQWDIKYHMLCEFLNKKTLAFCEKLSVGIVDIQAADNNIT